MTSTAKWSNLDPFIHVYDLAEKDWRKMQQPEDYDYEQCYHDEIKQFLTCIETGEPWPITIETSQEVVRVLLALKQSSESKRTVRLAEVMV